MHQFFLTGTDTDCGKTFISAALLQAAAAQGFTTLGLKPVAAGCQLTADGLRNDDALILQANSSLPLSYAEVNPVALPMPCSPHIAAAAAGVRVSIDQLVGYCRGALGHRADFALIEGAGGWRVPLNEREALSALPKALATPVILVVGVRLGAINMALLTVEAILRDGLTIAGWVANCVQPEMLAVEENIATLQRLLPAPCLGVIPWQPGATPPQIAKQLDVVPLNLQKRPPRPTLRRPG